MNGKDHTLGLSRLLARSTVHGAELRLDLVATDAVRDVLRRRTELQVLHDLDPEPSPEPTEDLTDQALWTE